MTVADILRFRSCRPIRGCPGRWLISGADRLDPGALAGGTLEVGRFRRTSVPDEIWVCALEGGGFISYRKLDGRFVHTVCDGEGFERKLVKLGISREDIP